jgi:APA family basic amino acid/polyamine antiporter
VVKALDLGFLQAPAEVYVGILAATILLIATNAGIIGVSRLVYSMGIHRQLPDALRRLHPRYGTPWLGIAIFGTIACLTLIPGKAAFLGNVYAFGAMLSFTIAHVSLIRLRIKVHDERPWRGPGNLRVGGYDLPLFAVVGGTATFVALIVLAARNPVVTIFGVSWLAFGCIVYVVYRHRQGLNLTETKRVAVPQPVIDHEAEYESVLVAFDDPNHYNAAAVGTARRLAARRRRGIHVLVTIIVPSSSPIGAALPEQERAAQEIIEQAKLQGGRRVTGHWIKVRAGQAGSAIVKEARVMRAQAVVMALAPRGGATLFSRTVETVLSQRPCRVIIVASPGQSGPRPELVAAAVAP